MNITMWKDDRSEEQMSTHTVIVAARDTSSLYADVTNRYGGNTAAWACRPDDADGVFDWVYSRPKMKRVRFTDVKNLERIEGLVHIYVGRKMRADDW